MGVKMNKIFILIFIGLVVIAGASAGLVTYLSNTITADVTVKSPIQVWFGDNAEDVLLEFDEIYGGEDFSYVTNSRNMAENAVDAYPILNIIESDSEWTGLEFTVVSACISTQSSAELSQCGTVDSGIYHVKENGEIIPFKEIGAEHTKEARLLIHPPTWPVEKMNFDPEQMTISEYTFVTAPNVEGKFQFRLCHLYDLAGIC